MKILFVEDDAFCADTQRGIAEALKLDYRFASTYQQACEALDEDKFDIVVTDFNFPGGNGDLVSKLARDSGVRAVYLFSSDPSAVGCYTQSLGKDFLLLRSILTQSIKV